MSKKKPSSHKKKSTQYSPKQRASAPALAPWQIAVLVGVVALVAGVLWLKNRPATTENVAAGPPVLVTPTGEGVAEAQEFLPVEETAPPPVPAVETSLAPRAGESPEAHLDRLLEEGQPVFAFFHSTTCYQCTEMDKIVQQVHPAFADQVALVDVNVYDDANQTLLQRAGIRVIPTLIFIDRAGAGQGYNGLMPAEQLQEALTTLAAGGMP
ncbi:MAG: thioredoxin family protein [Anaerolineae bacterium]|nr:thioredoxin family protein [Anaerolineae bacterium]